MSPKPSSFAGIIARWPSFRDFREAINVPDGTVRAWITRDRIPAEHWADIIRLARDNGIDVTFDDLADALNLSRKRKETDRRRERRRYAA
jgi:hypothetical protein